MKNEYELLIQEIKEYDSDTFCAGAVDLTDEEANDLADKCVRWFVLNRLDGVMLSEFLDSIRDEDE